VLRLFAGAALAVALISNIRGATGDLYVADPTQRVVYKFTPPGVRSNFATGFYQPVALAFDRKGNLFVGDKGSFGSPPSTIFRLTPNGTKSTFATIGTNDLLGMAFDATGNLFVSTGEIILKFTPNGTQTTFATNVGGVWPLAFDKLGNLYAGVNPIGPSSILKFTPDGSRTTFTSLPGCGTETLAFDPSGNLFAGDCFAIEKITPAGALTTFASLDPKSAFAMAFDNNGNLFVGLDSFDASEPAIVKFTPTGVRTTFAFGTLGTLWAAALAFEPSKETLRNISARGVVSLGDNVLIAGFVLGGNALNNSPVLVRAIGPSLAAHGITNPLQDPMLELHNADGALVASNNNWQDTQRAQILATHLQPTNPRESAIFATLSGGSYTAIIRGANNSVGIGLVEVYNLSN
jgi:sugar lactone lactonase YvrE